MIPHPPTPPPTSPRRAVCRSQGPVQFNPIRPVRKARTKPLSFCHKYKQNTCCNRTHTDVIMRQDRFAVAAHFAEPCRAMTELFLCKICDPRVGTMEVSTVCPGTCRRWFGACKDEFYSAGTSVLVPCTESSLVCSTLKDIVPNGKAFCRRMGHSVHGDGANGDGDGEGGDGDGDGDGDKDGEGDGDRDADEADLAGFESFYSIIEESKQFAPSDDTVFGQHGV